MTRSELNQVLSWLDAGKLQIRLGREWVDYVIGKHADIWYPTDQFELYRQKHTPTLRPWRPEEVPVGALLKSDNMLPTLIMSTYIDKVLQKPCISFIRYNSYMDRLDVDRMFCSDLLTNIYHCVHSVDHGKTWLPCGVAE